VIVHIGQMTGLGRDICGRAARPNDVGAALT
jgi:hypothetical protein